MNRNRIKQLFVEFSEKLPVSGLADADKARSQTLDGPMLVRDQLVLRDEAALEYVEMLGKVSEIIAKDGAWSRTSIDDLLAESVFNVVAAKEDRAQAIRAQTDRILDALKSQPDTWQIDIAVAGISTECSGKTFGNLLFLRDTVKNQADTSEENGERGEETLLFARVRVEAIDVESAMHRAAPLIDRHLAVLNALFSDWQPSRIHLYRGEPKPIIRKRVSRAQRVGADNPQTQFGNKLTGTILSRDEWDGFTHLRGGVALSTLLTQDNSFANRIVTGYVTAGTACVEEKSQLAFLLFAIALEGVVLGSQTKGEITYQLSTRVAHLLGSTLDARRSVVKQVTEFYKLRSGIAHFGKNDVTEADVYAIRNVCLRSLQTLVTSTFFEKMNTVEELDQWFNDRLLDGGQVAAAPSSS